MQLFCRGEYVKWESNEVGENTFYRVFDKMIHAKMYDVNISWRQFKNKTFF